MWCIIPPMRTALTPVPHTRLRCRTGSAAGAVCRAEGAGKPTPPAPAASKPPRCKPTAKPAPLPEDGYEQLEMMTRGHGDDPPELCR